MHSAIPLVSRVEPAFLKASKRRRTTHTRFLVWLDLLHHLTPHRWKNVMEMRGPMGLEQKQHILAELSPIPELPLETKAAVALPTQSRVLPDVRLFLVHQCPSYLKLMSPSRRNYTKSIHCNFKVFKHWALAGFQRSSNTMDHTYS